MKIFLVSAAQIGEVPANAEALVFGEITGVSASTAICKTERINGNETFETIQDDEKDEEVVKGRRVFDAQAGYAVVGVAPTNVIESEFTNYTQWQGINDGAGNVLFKGILKSSQTESYTPQFLSYVNVQFK